MSLTEGTIDSWLTRKTQVASKSICMYMFIKNALLERF